MSFSTTTFLAALLLLLIDGVAFAYMAQKFVELLAEIKRCQIRNECRQLQQVQQVGLTPTQAVSALATVTDSAIARIAEETRLPEPTLRRVIQLMQEKKSTTEVAQ